MIRRAIRFIIGCRIKKGDLVRYNRKGLFLGNIHRVSAVKFIAGIWWVEFEENGMHQACNYKKINKENKSE